MIHRESLAEFHKYYEKDDEIGNGSFGTVFKASRKDYPGEFVAVKEVSKESRAEEMLEALWNEVRIMERILHPHVLRTYEVIDTPLQLMFVMEFCTGGEFLIQVKRTKEPLGEQETAKMALDILGALRFLHFKGISHRDLKPENVLRDKFGGVKVADFGMANRFKASLYLKRAMTGMCGTAGYWAPEVCTGGQYTEKCDIWSLGIITFYALSGGSVPFPRTEENEFGTAMDESDVTRLNMPRQWSSASKEWIKVLLTFNLDDRPAAKQAVELKFVKSMQDLAEATGRLPPDGAKEFCDFAEAPLLTRALGIVAARHLHIARVPDIASLRNGFDNLDQGRDGYVYVTTIARAIESSGVKFDIDLNLLQQRFEEIGKITGSKEGCVDWGVFLATKAIKHVHSIKAAFHIVKDVPQGITIRALQDLVLNHCIQETRLSVEKSKLLPDELQGCSESEVVPLQQLLKLLNFEFDGPNPDRPRMSEGAIDRFKSESNTYTEIMRECSTNMATHGSATETTGFLCCKRRARILPLPT